MNLNLNLNMKAEDKRRRFHDALLQMLYPTTPTPTTTKKEGNHTSLHTLIEAPNSDQFLDELQWDRELQSSSSADETEVDDGPKKLTRAQRKRLRKKKLKEAASRRRKVIGPNLPSPKDDGVVEATGDVADKGPPGVRQIAHIGPKSPESEVAPSCSKPNKQKHRRTAKKLARESLKSSSTEDQGCCGLSDKG